MIGAVLGLVRGVPMVAWAIVAALAWGGIQHARATRAVAALAEERAKIAAEREAALRGVLIEKVAAARRAQEATDEAERAKSRLEAERGRLDRAVRGLRERVAAAAPTPAAAASVAASGASAGGAGDLCPELLGRVAEAAGRIAVYADGAVIAAEACRAASTSDDERR